jgi:hypothetical protein
MIARVTSDSEAAEAIWQERRMKVRHVALSFLERIERKNLQDFFHGSNLHFHRSQRYRGYSRRPSTFPDGSLSGEAGASRKDLQPAHID